jgi:hypothetical protein
MTSVLDDLLDGPNPPETMVTEYSIKNEENETILSFEIHKSYSWFSRSVGTCTFGYICNIILYSEKVDANHLSIGQFPMSHPSRGGELTPSSQNATAFIGYLHANMNEADKGLFLQSLTQNLSANIQKYIPEALLQTPQNQPLKSQSSEQAISQGTFAPT